MSKRSDVQSDSIRFQSFFDTRRMHLPVLLLIVLLHLILVFCWPAKKGSTSTEMEPPRLWVWNIAAIRELKRQDKLQSTHVGRHSQQQRAEKRLMSSSSTLSPSIGQKITSNFAAKTPAAPAMQEMESASPPPLLDLNSVREQALAMDQRRVISPIERLHEVEFVPHTIGTDIDGAATRGRRQDCQTAYSGAGLLALVPLVIDTITDKGCKWK